MGFIDIQAMQINPSCRSVATLTAGVRNSAATPILWAAALQPQLPPLIVGVSIGDAALRQQCVTQAIACEHPDASIWSGHLAWRRTPPSQGSNMQPLKGCCLTFPDRSSASGHLSSPASPIQLPLPCRASYAVLAHSCACNASAHSWGGYSCGCNAAAYS